MAGSIDADAFAASVPGVLTVHQRLPTSGARTALPFRLGGDLYLGVPQLAEDVAGQAAHMNAGDSDVDAILYRWRDGSFVEEGRLPTPGGEDMLVFEIGDDIFLATASIRTGSGPYDMNAVSRVYRRDGGEWAPFQDFPSFAAKQWCHFTFDGRHFLALAQGVTVPTAQPRHPRESRIFEWDGARFTEFQVLDGLAGYNWAFFEHAGKRFLGYADHVGASLLHVWDGARFAPFQTLSDQGGRAFRFFEEKGQGWLAFAAINGDSTLYRWDGEHFVGHQHLGGQGGREFELLRAGDDLYLVRICFIEGTPADPRTDINSQLYRWTGSGFDIVLEFPTFGGTDASAFEADGGQYLAVSNSLTPDVRFRQDMVIYQVRL